MRKIPFFSAVGFIAVLFASVGALLASPVQAANKTYTDALGKYSIQYPDTWTVTKPTGSNSDLSMLAPRDGGMSVVPGTNAMLLGMTISNINKQIKLDPTNAANQQLQTALKAGWKPFLKEAKSQVSSVFQGYAATETPYTLKKYTAVTQTFSQDADGMVSVLKYYYVTKDKKTVYQISDMYAGDSTKTVKEPYAGKIRSIIQSLTIL